MEAAQDHGEYDTDESEDGSSNCEDDEVREPVARTVKETAADPPRGDHIAEEDDNAGDEAADGAELYATFHEARF